MQHLCVKFGDLSCMVFQISKKAGTQKTGVKKLNQLNRLLKNVFILFQSGASRLRRSMTVCLGLFALYKRFIYLFTQLQQAAAADRRKIGLL